MVLGAGGHARVVIDALQAMGHPVIAALDSDPAKAGTTILGVPILAEDSLRQFAPADVLLANGIGGIADTSLRQEVFHRIKEHGFEAATVRHPTAIISRYAEIREGAQIMAGAIVQACTVVGVNAIVNTGARVDHDCHIGDHVHIAPGAMLSGGAHIGDGAHVGIGAIILQSRVIGPGAVVGAGAVVISDVEAGVTVIGSPARPRERMAATSQGASSDRRP